MQVGVLQAVPCDFDIAAIDRGPESVEQRLIDLQIEITGSGGIQVDRRAVHQAAVTHKRECIIRAGGEVLTVLKNVLAIVVSQRVCLVQQQIRLRAGEMPVAGRREDKGIEARRRRTGLRHNAPDRSDAGAGGESTAARADSGQTDALRTGQNRSIDAAKNATALRAAQHFTREKRTVALNGNIEVVFEHQRNYVLRG